MIPAGMPMPEATLFFALSVPDPVRALVGRLQDEARRAFGPARYPELEGLHITLAFLGRTDPARASALLALAARAAGPGFALRTAGTGGFPRPGRARILWLGFAPEPALGSLAERLREALKAGGVAFDDKPFAPHLTLARFREPVDLRRAACMAQAPVAFEVRELGLFQSVPGPRGNSYRPLGASPFTP
jgi:2'-5' RNA ligase